MRNASIPRHYWDACLFIDLVNQTPEKIDALDGLWTEANGASPKSAIVTSALTIGEVLYCAHEKLQRKLDDAALKKIDALWSPKSAVELVEVYPTLIIEARGLARELLEEDPPRSLKLPDAIHIASALKRRCTKLLTYDPGLLRFDGRFGILITKPKFDGLAFSGSATATS